MYINIYNTADNCVFMLYFFDYFEKKNRTIEKPSCL